MKPQLTLSVLLSADGKMATRTGEPMASLASGEFSNRLATSRSEADGLLVDTSLPAFYASGDRPVIAVGSSDAWLTTLDSFPQDKLVRIDDVQGITSELFEQAAHHLKIQNIHCEPSPQLARQLLKEKVVCFLNITIIPSLTGGHAADTMTGNGAAATFLHSQRYSLISHEQTGDEIHLRYSLQPSSPVTNPNDDS